MWWERGADGRLQRFCKDDLDPLERLWALKQVGALTEQQHERAVNKMLALWRTELA